MQDGAIEGAMNRKTSFLIHTMSFCCRGMRRFLVREHVSRGRINTVDGLMAPRIFGSGGGNGLAAVKARVGYASMLLN